MSNKKDKAFNKKSERDLEGAVVPLDGRTLTDMQAAFVQAFCGGPTAGNATKSCVVAGYSQSSAPQIGCQLLKLPHIADAIDVALREAIGSRLSVKAVATLERILDDPDASDTLKGDLAAKVVKFSGLADRVQAQKTKETGLGGKALGELSRAELERIVAQGALVLKAAQVQEKTIEVPFSAQNSAQVEAIAAE